MDKEFKTTFIPKKTAAQSDTKSGIKDPIKRPKTRSLVGLIAVLLFVTAAVSAVGVFLLKSQVQTRINQNIRTINEKDQEFDPEAILELRKLDIRLGAANELLDNHVVVSEFLRELGTVTLPEVAFDGFGLSEASNIMEVGMTGVARRFENIAQQSDIFDANPYIENHIFSGFTLTEDGSVSFNLVFTLDPELVKFGHDSDLQVDSQVLESSIQVELENITIPNQGGLTIINN